MSTIVNQKQIQDKSRTDDVNVIFNGDRVATVEVTSGKSGDTYRVQITKTGDRQGAICNCNWGLHRPHGENAQRSACHHVIAAYNAINEKPVYAWKTEADADRQKKAKLFIGDGTWITIG